MHQDIKNTRKNLTIAIIRLVDVYRTPFTVVSQVKKNLGQAGMLTDYELHVSVNMHDMMGCD